MNKETREGDYTQGIAALSYYKIRELRNSLYELGYWLNEKVISGL